MIDSRGNYTQIDDIIDAMKELGQYDVAVACAQPEPLNYKCAAYSGGEKFIRFEDTMFEGDCLSTNELKSTDSEITVVRVKCDTLNLKRRASKWEMMRYDVAIPGDGSHLGASPSMVNLVTLVQGNEYLVPLSSWDPYSRSSDLAENSNSASNVRSQHTLDSCCQSQDEENSSASEAKSSGSAKRPTFSKRISKFLRKHCRKNSKTLPESCSHQSCQHSQGSSKGKRLSKKKWRRSQSKVCDTGNAAVSTMEYREMRDRMMQTNGTTAQETFSVILPSFFYTSLAVLLVSSLGVTSGTAAFFVEFVTLVAPIILNITVLSEYNVEIVVAAASLYLVILLPFSRKRERTAEKNTDFITNARATITIISVIAILAVDFTVFPRKFAKTEHFGYSLMDVGVGLFVFSNGIVDSTRRHPISSTLPLIILAVARFVTVKQLDYHVPVSEYGVHWNFFATLALTKLFTNLLLSVINIKFILINSIMLLFSHELLLQNGLANLILSTKIKRSDGFVAANKEGIGSCLGYISIYLLAAYFSHLLDLKNTKTRTKTTLLKFVAVCGLFLGLTVLLGAHFGVSRKLANSAYCCWVLFIGFFMTGLFYGNGALTGQGAPHIFRAVNYNGLIFFLSCNVCTGLVNILCDSLKVGPAGGLAIVFGYMFVNCAFVCVLYAKRIKPNF